jgi:uncharacterized membrane protein YphA (DoxX/SURF4 family)
MKQLIASKGLVAARLVALYLLGVVFVYAGATKANVPQDFAQNIMNYHLVSESTAIVLASTLPALEIVTGLSLLLGVWRQGGLVLISLMSIIFIVALGSLIVRGINVDCGCFHQYDGVMATPAMGIAKNLLILVLAGFSWSYACVQRQWFSFWKLINRRNSGESASILPQ